MIYNLLFKQEVVATPGNFTFSSLSLFFRVSLYYTYNNYNILYIYIYTTNVVIKNNYGRVKDRILLFKIPVGMQNISSKFKDELEMSYKMFRLPRPSRFNGQ
jgi:hypothetical protein